MSAPIPSSLLFKGLLDELLATIAPVVTVVLNTPLKACYGAVVNGTPQDVELDATGSYTIPTGGTLVIQVLKQDPTTGQFSVIATNTSMDSSGNFKVIIPAASHGITPTTGCGTFLFQPSITFPSGGPRPKFFGGQSFEICPTCPPDSNPPAPTALSARPSKGKKK